MSSRPKPSVVPSILLPVHDFSQERAHGRDWHRTTGAKRAVDKAALMLVNPRETNFSRASERIPPRALTNHIRYLIRPSVRHFMIITNLLYRSTKPEWTNPRTLNRACTMIYSISLPRLQSGTPISMGLDNRSLEGRTYPERRLNGDDCRRSTKCLRGDATANIIEQPEGWKEIRRDARSQAVPGFIDLRDAARYSAERHGDVRRGTKAGKPCCSCFPLDKRAHECKALTLEASATVPSPPSEFRLNR